MSKKIVSCVLIASMLSTIGCHNIETITRDQLDVATKEKLNAEAERFDITVTTKDFKEYNFLKDSYRINGDTLTGFGIQTSNENEERFHGSIPIADIASLETKEFSLWKTILTIGLPVASVTVFLVLLAHGMSKI